MKRQTLAILAASALFPASSMAQAQSPDSDSSAEAQVSASSSNVSPPSAESSVPPPSSSADQSMQADEVHTVTEGDTLWDLSERYLGSPWYWPKVWSYNPQIDNPHMIYPGNTIRFSPAAKDGSAEELPAQLSVAQPERKEAALAGEDDSREYMDDEDELVTVSEGKTIGLQQSAASDTMQQSTFMAVEEFKAAGKIDSAFSEKHMLSVYDKVYLTFEDVDKVHLGDLYTIVRTGDEIHHPVSGDSAGFQIDAIGTVRITSLDSDHITGLIESATDEIHRGDLVTDLSEFEKKDVEQKKENNGDEDIRGIIMAAQNPILPMLGEHHIVFVDKGANDGVQVGNVFEVIRSGDPTWTADETSGKDQEDDAYPEETVALISVIDVNETTSIGFITRAIYEISIGENVVIRSKNPDKNKKKRPAPKEADNAGTEKPAE